MLNITLVLSQSSQSQQQQAEQLITNILQDDSRGKWESERETTLPSTHVLAAESTMFSF